MVRAYFTVGPGQGELRHVILPPRAPGQVRVRARYSGVSCGTELLVHRGLVPDSERVRMRAPHQEGGLPWPVKYGYCSVGEVVETDPGERSLLGRAVFSLHPHQSEYQLETSELHVLPAGLPLHRAVLAANAETAINALWDGGLGAGDRVTVVGAGLLGTLVGHFAAAHPGVEVQLVDIDTARSALAAQLGLALLAPEAADAERDLVIHASGTSAGLRTALTLAGQEATVVELSWYGTREVTLPLGGPFHSRRLRLIASQVGGIPADRRARWTTRRRLALALEQLADERLDGLLGDAVPLSALPELMQALDRGDRSALCPVVHYDEE